MSDQEKRFEEASNDQIYLFASDPHRIAAARTRSEHLQRGRKRPKRAVEDTATITRYAKLPAFLRVSGIRQGICGRLRSRLLKLSARLMALLQRAVR